MTIPNTFLSNSESQRKCELMKKVTKVLVAETEMTTYDYNG